MPDKQRLYKQGNQAKCIKQMHSLVTLSFLPDSGSEYDSVVLDQTQLDPALANMKSDDLDYPNSATPEPSG